MRVIICPHELHGHFRCQPKFGHSQRKLQKASKSFNLAVSRTHHWKTHLQHWKTNLQYVIIVVLGLTIPSGILKRGQFVIRPKYRKWMQEWYMRDLLCRMITVTDLTISSGILEGGQCVVCPNMALEHTNDAHKSSLVLVIDRSFPTLNEILETKKSFKSF